MMKQTHIVSRARGNPISIRGHIYFVERPDYHNVPKNLMYKFRGERALDYLTFPSGLILSIVQRSGVKVDYLVELRDKLSTILYGTFGVHKNLIDKSDVY